MPTSNPRIQVTLSPSLDALVTRLAELQRVSKSSVLRELLETAEPQLTQVVALMEAASKAQMEARTSLSRDMQRALNDANKHAQIALEKASNVTRDLVAEAEGITGRRPSRAASKGRAPVAAGRAGGRKDPPASNRGVKR